MRLQDHPWFREICRIPFATPKSITMDFEYLMEQAKKQNGKNKMEDKMKLNKEDKEALLWFINRFKDDMEESKGCFCDSFTPKEHIAWLIEFLERLVAQDENK